MSKPDKHDSIKLRAAASALPPVTNANLYVVASAVGTPTYGASAKLYFNFMATPFAIWRPPARRIFMSVSGVEPLAPQNYAIPNLGGITTAVNNLGVAGAQVIGPDAQRRSITFANPNIVGNINLLVFQMLDAAGASLAGVTFATPGGGWPLLPGAIITFSGDVQGAWGAVAQSGVTGGLTVISSRS